MNTFKKIGFLLFFLGIFNFTFAQTSDYLIIDAPIGAQSSSKVLTVKWAGLSRGPSYAAPDSGDIYYDRAPGGGNLANYRYKISKPWTDTVTKIEKDNILDLGGKVASRYTSFRAMDQAEMGFGVFYCVVAFPCKNALNVNDTLVSNEFTLIIESPNAVDWISPNDSITELTPSFSWHANPGVPYYHIILSDEAISIDTNDSGNVDLSGLSIIWQAITPNTQMVYGAPDPSHTITADPPPLSPGKRYTWIVLNNYGNHPAFSSTKVKLPPGEFVIKGKTLKKPVPLYPKNVELNSTDNKKFTFKWTNLDSNANTYKIYAYLGSDFEGIGAKLIVWQTEVGASSASDTMSVEIDASSVLTSNKYVWNVIAVDNKGAGTVGDTAGFKYNAPTGTLKIFTRELVRVPKGDSIVKVINEVGLVEVKVEVLDGSLEAPLLFYTDLHGKLDRDRPTGAYRITAIKSEFESQTKTITLHEGETLIDTFYLERPESTIYGKVVDAASKGINLANVYGVSDLKDTLKTTTDASGNFILKCYGSDWNIWSEMTGYKAVLAAKVTVISAQNLNFGTITMQKNPFTLSGTVKNGSGDPLLGVTVRLYQSGQLVDELLSTPQSGVFSFSISSGTYTITADKTGFTSYSSAIDMLSSKTLSITMQPGATVVNGYIYGKTWVGSRNNYVYAPVTNAKVKIVKLGGTDTVTVTSGYTYGEFKTSLPGGQKFLVYSSANGFAVKNVPCTLVTQTKTTQTFYDTLNAYATVNGSVKLSSQGTVLGNCIVNLLSIPDGTVMASGRTSSDGRFEIQGIMDGLYTLMAGKEGYVLDSIEGSDSITVTDGRPDKSTIAFFMKSGDKTVKWYSSVNGSVKIRSPLIKNLAYGDTLANAGSGTYVVQYDAAADTVIDCSYHRFTVADTEMIHTDTVPMILRHKSSDTVTLVNGYAQLALSAADSLDSAKIFYRDITSGTYYESKNYTKSDQVFTFSIIPPRDGSTMLYYITGYKGNNVYGYEKETYHSYIRPDRTRLSKFEILPSSQDTLVYPSSYKALFSFRGYVSSAFIQDSSVNGQSVHWSITNAQGCSLLSTTGISVNVQTGSVSTPTSPVILVATIDTSITKLAAGVSPVISIPFLVSGTALYSLNIRRIDAQNPNPITTSSVDRAEFAADGMDAKGKVLQISPAWSISPAVAGKISEDGIFRPSKNFVGTVHIYAQSNGFSSEYVNSSNTQGLKVRFVVVNKNTPDTATDGNGCQVVFPSNVVSGSDIGIVEVTSDTLNNRVEMFTGKYKTSSLTAYEIKQLENISFNTSSDSIKLLLKIQDEKNADQKYYLGCWNADSLKWDILANSFIDTLNQKVGAKLSHFSKYTILSEAQSSGYLSVSPNAFSPYVNQRQVNPLRPYYGTCIQFRIQSQKQVNGKIVIYNVLGDVVWSMNIDNMSTSTYQIWWDGKSVSHEINSGIIQKTVGENGEVVYAPRGDKMCRNGRYFVLLTGTEQIDKKHYRYMKPVVLMK